MTVFKIAWLFSRWAFFQDFWHFFKIFGILTFLTLANLDFFNFSKEIFCHSFYVEGKFLCIWVIVF